MSGVLTIVYITIKVSIDIKLPSNSNHQMAYYMATNLVEPNKK